MNVNFVFDEIILKIINNAKCIMRYSGICVHVADLTIKEEQKSNGWGN